MLTDQNNQIAKLQKEIEELQIKVDHMIRIEAKMREVMGMVLHAQQDELNERVSTLRDKVEKN